MSLRPYRTFIIVAFVFIALMFALEHINGRFWLSDFKVYWGAADALFRGNAVYGVPFGESTGYYKYSPFVALLFTPFAALPFEVASIIWFGCIAVALVAALLQLHWILIEIPIARRMSDNALLCLSLLCVGNHVVRELHLGNINLPLLLLATLAFRRQATTPWAAGAVLALLFMVKPYLGLVALPMLLQGRWQIVRGAVVCGSAMLLLPIILGPGKAFALHREWLASMSAHGDYLTSGNTIASLLAHIPGVKDGTGLQLGIVFLAVFLISALAWRWRNGTSTAHHFLLHFGALALIPNLVITDTQHFLLALPMFMFVLHRIHALTWPNVFLFILVVLAHGANSSDLLGHALSDGLNAHGILGIANLILLLVAYLLLRRAEVAD